MATGDLSLKITVGGSNYYVSDQEYLATDANFHYGYVLTAPSITLGTTRGGYANFSSGKACSITCLGTTAWWSRGVLVSTLEPFPVVETIKARPDCSPDGCAHCDALRHVTR